MLSQYVSVKDISPMHINRSIRVRLVRTYQVPELRGGQTSKSMELFRDIEGTYIHANILRNDVAKCIDIFSEGKQNTLKCTVWDGHVATMIPFYNADLKEPLIVVLQLCRAKIVNVSGQSPVRSISIATILSQPKGIGDFTSGSKTYKLQFHSSYNHLKTLSKPSAAAIETPKTSREPCPDRILDDVGGAFDCSMVYICQKEDPWNSIIVEAATGGVLSLRQGLGASADLR
nr:mitochondrial import inner membrane translocase subunit TIM17-2-like [Ipomoea batatas]